MPRTIKILKTTDASPDGITVETYEKDRLRVLSENLADVFVAEGWGEDVNTSETDAERLAREKAEHEKAEAAAKEKAAADAAAAKAATKSGKAATNGQL